MNLPNRLTLFRCVMSPLFAICFCIMQRAISYNARIAGSIICLALYACMEITDAVDGRIARKRGLVTDLGKVFDPFSDSIMHMTFFALFSHFGLIAFVAFYIMMARELSILFLRLLLAKTGTILPANVFGKLKTVSYAVLSFLTMTFSTLFVIGCVSLDFERYAFSVLHALSYVAAFFSLFSFAMYLFKDAIKSGALRSITK